MATVFLADDLKHERKVAVKVLRPELAAALGADRFTREIRIAARLQHPHILPLLDSGQSEGFLYYVMPYVEGQSLRDRLAREGELPVHEAVRILVEVADALAFAHAQGVVHRDIKPDNILLSGRHALVMDFGVAKAVSEATGRHSLTTAGVALGTPAYMAPEQATADPNLDHRVDIYAVGAMGYELLTGRTPFAGLTPQQMLAAHVTEEPAPLTRYRPSLSPALQNVVMRCLAKHPADRWQTAQELLAQLEPLMTPSGGMTPVQTQPVAAVRPSTAPASAALWPKLAIGAVLLAIVTGGLLLARRRPAALVLGRQTQVTLDVGLDVDPALSPDGKLVAYAVGPAGSQKIVVRQLEGGGTIALTAGVAGDLRRPQWTPDGSRIAFQSPRGIEIVPALGGVPKLMVESPTPDTASDVTFSPDRQRIAYRVGDSLYVRATDGGPARQLAKSREVYSLAWSPDGKWIAYVSGNPQYIYGISSVLGNLAPSLIMVVPAEGGTPAQVAGENALNLSPVWLPDSRELLFVSNRDGSRDIYRISIGSSGKPVAPAERLTTGLNAATISLTPDGRRLAYTTFTQTSNISMLPFPKGAAVSSGTATPVTSGNQIVESFDISSDGKWLVFDSDRNGNQDIFRMPLPGGDQEQLTTDPADDFQPHYSHDGRLIGFHTFRNGKDRDLYVMSATGADQRPVVASPAQDRDAGWSSDDQRMSFSSDITGRSEIYTIARQGDGWGKPVQLTRNGGIFPFWSRDGKWIAYSWTRGIVVVPAGGGEPTTLPMTGPLAGRQADAFAYTWSPDSRHLLIVVSNDTIPRQTVWSVPLEAGEPRPLVEFDDPNTTFGRGAFAVHDTTLYITLLRSESDIWVTEIERR